MNAHHVSGAGATAFTFLLVEPLLNAGFAVAMHALLDISAYPRPGLRTQTTQHVSSNFHCAHTFRLHHYLILILVRSACGHHGHAFCCTTLFENTVHPASAMHLQPFSLSHWASPLFHPGHTHGFRTGHFHPSSCHGSVFLGYLYHNVDHFRLRCSSFGTPFPFFRFPLPHKALSFFLDTRLYACWFLPLPVHHRRTDFRQLHTRSARSLRVEYSVCVPDIPPSLHHRTTASIRHLTFAGLPRLPFTCCFAIYTFLDYRNWISFTARTSFTFLFSRVRTCSHHICHFTALCTRHDASSRRTILGPLKIPLPARCELCLNSRLPLCASFLRRRLWTTVCVSRLRTHVLHAPAGLVSTAHTWTPVRHCLLNLHTVLAVACYCVLSDAAPPPLRCVWGMRG